MTERGASARVSARAGFLLLAVGSAALAGLVGQVGTANAQREPDGGVAPDATVSVDASSPVDAHVGADAAGPPDAGFAADAGEPDASAPDAGEPEPELPLVHRPRIRVTLEPANTIPTGSVVRVLVAVDALEDDDVTLPSQSFAPLELHSRRVAELTARGRTVTTFTLELLALAPGDVEIEPIAIRVLTSDGLVGTVQTEPIRLRVTSVLGNEPNAEPRGPTRPRELREEDVRPLYALAALGMMLVGAVIAMFVRRWLARRPKPVVPPPPPRPAWELAFERLEALRIDGPAMIAEGRVGPWIDSLSDTVRDYLGQRYGFDGLECTSDEVIRRVESMRIHSLAATELTMFLGECDLVKFAQASMTVEQAESMFRQAQRIVRATIPGGAAFGSVGSSGRGGAP